MVYASSLKEYRRYFAEVHKIIYGEESEDYACFWAKIVWERQEKGFGINLPSLKELGEAKTVMEKIKMINRGVFGDIQN